MNISCYAIVSFITANNPLLQESILLAFKLKSIKLSEYSPHKKIIFSVLFGYTNAVAIMVVKT